MHNVYYDPEHFNAEVIGSIDIGWSYVFDILAVFKDKSTGKLYWGTDAGCSCPTPFEDYSAVTELRELYSVQEFATFARQWVSGQSPQDKEFVENLIRKVRARMRRATR